MLIGSSNADKAALYAPDLPWNTFKPSDLGPCVMNFVNDHEPYFRRWAEVWYENFQFLFGNQNLRWSRKYGFAVDYDFLRTNNGNTTAMRANTNITRVIVEALTSFIYGNVPDWAAETMDESSLKGKRFQKIAERLLECYNQRLLLHKELRVAAAIYVIFGQVGTETEWNRMAGTLIDVPRYKKVLSPVYSTYMSPNPATGGLIEVPTQLVDESGMPIQEQTWEPVRDGKGRQVIDKMFTGDVSVNMLTPFEYRRELGKYGMHKTRYVQRFKLLDYDEYLDMYENIDGKTDRFHNIRPVYSDPVVYNMAIRHFMRMQFTTPPTAEDGYRRFQNVFKSSLFRYKVFVVEHWDKPHPKKWPEGRRLVIANGECVAITKPDYSTNKMDGWHPFTEAQWLTAAPNSLAAGPVNDVVRKNKELNIKDSLMATAVRRNMGSELLVKSNSGYDPQKKTGEPGNIQEVNDINGVRWLHDDMPIPPVMSRLREMDKEDVYETSGAGDALRGESSSGATSGYQERQREEREEKRVGPARKEFEFAVSGMGEKLVACLKANAIKLDENVMGFLKRAAAGEFSTQDVVAFLSSPIGYGVDIKVVKSSMIIKSKATMQATLQELAGGALGPRLANDAKVLDEYLKYFDAETLRDASAPHRDRACRENEVFLDMFRLGPDTDGIQTPIVLFEDDDDIHMQEHAEFMIKNFEDLRNNPALLEQVIIHNERHRLQKQEKMGQLMPGASTQTAVMEKQAMQAALPTVQTVFQDTQMRKQAEMRQQQGAQNPAPAPAGQQQQTAKGPGGAAKPPQAPRLPSGPGQGAGRIDPNAPSQNTPASKGGML